MEQKLHWVRINCRSCRTHFIGYYGIFSSINLCSRDSEIVMEQNSLWESVGKSHGEKPIHIMGRTEVKAFGLRRIFDIMRYILYIYSTPSTPAPSFFTINTWYRIDWFYIFKNMFSWYHMNVIENNYLLCNYRSVYWPQGKYIALMEIKSRDSHKIWKNTHMK